jgi:hypothetical protein
MKESLIMRFHGISWIDIRTERYSQMVAFFKQLGLISRIDERDFAMFKLLDGDQIEIFGPGMRTHSYFTQDPSPVFWSTTSEPRGNSLRRQGPS